MPNRQVEAAARARERELHLLRLQQIERSKSSVLPTPPKPRPASARLPGPRPPSQAVRLEASLEQEAHRRKLEALAEGSARRRQQQQAHALESGRAVLGTGAARRSCQKQVAQENQALMRRLRNMQPRLASPAEIALLTGKPAGGAAGLAKNAAVDDGDDEDD